MGIWKDTFGDNLPDMTSIPTVEGLHSGIGETFIEAGLDGSDVPPVIHNDHLWEIVNHLGLEHYKPGERFNVHENSTLIITTPNTVDPELGINGSICSRAGDIRGILESDGACAVIVVK